MDKTYQCCAVCYHYQNTLEHGGFVCLLTSKPKDDPWKKNHCKNIAFIDMVTGAMVKPK